MRQLTWVIRHDEIFMKWLSRFRAGDKPHAVVDNQNIAIAATGLGEEQNRK